MSRPSGSSRLIISHFKRLIGAVPEGAFDVTFSQMVIAQKLTSFAWNVHDGRRKLEVSRGRPGGEADGQDLDAAQQALRLQHVPSPLAYLGYWRVFLADCQTTAHCLASSSRPCSSVHPWIMSPMTR